MVIRGWPSLHALPQTKHCMHTVTYLVVPHRGHLSKEGVSVIGLLSLAAGPYGGHTGGVPGEGGVEDRERRRCIDIHPASLL